MSRNINGASLVAVRRERSSVSRRESRLFERRTVEKAHPACLRGSTRVGPWRRVRRVSEELYVDVWILSQPLLDIPQSDHAGVDSSGISDDVFTKCSAMKLNWNVLKKNIVRLI